MLRKTFLKTCGLGAFGLTALGSQASLLKFKNGASVTPRGSAENLIFVFLRGAASHVDTFDLKTGSWTPNDFGPANFGNLFLPGALFPKLAGHTDKFSLLRCINGNEAVHDRARYVFETSQTFNPTFSKEHPHIGSIMALELAAQRKSNDVLPTFLALNGNVQGSGMLSSVYAPFQVSGEQGVTGLEHPGGEALFNKRFESMLAVDRQNRLAKAAAGDAITDYHNFYTLGQGMMYHPDVQEVFSVTDGELARYGATLTGIGCATAVKALRKDIGTRVIQISQGGWDTHFDIYNRNVGNNIYTLTGELDPALTTMIEDLSGLPGKRGGSLLDETLIVVTGEFGRTPGPLTGNDGRDHYPYAWSAMVAGGGVTANQAFGATDADGAFITDPFWSQNRYITIQDIVATMYSSLGIDWTKEIQDTPSGRVYEYTPKEYGQPGYYKDIVEMFA